MSLINKRRTRSNISCKPCVEVLEDRQCLSVAAPTGLTATALSPTQVKLIWNDVANETSFNVYRWDGTKSVLAGSVAKNVTTFTIGSLPSNQTQYFSVEARDLTSTARSAWAFTTTPADPIALPTNLRFAGITQTSLKLQWDNAVGATGYNVYRWDGTQAILLGSTTPSTPSFQVFNLSPGVVNYFYVQAFNNTNSVSTDWVSASTLAYSLGTPTNVQAQTINAGAISLSWKDVAGETGYRIYQWDGNATSTPVVVATLAANTTGYIVTGLLPAKGYWFYVQAFNGSSTANSIWATSQTAAALPLQAPTQVTTAVTGSNSVRLTWVEPARAVGYRVYIWSGYGWNLATTVTAGNHSVVINGLARGYTNWFYVQAFTENSAELSYSNVVYANL